MYVVPYLIYSSPLLYVMQINLINDIVVFQVRSF